MNMCSNFHADICMLNIILMLVNFCPGSQALANMISAQMQISNQQNETKKKEKTIFFTFSLFEL